MFPVTQAFIPLLEKSSIGGGRIVNASSPLASTRTDVTGHNAKFGPVEAATFLLVCFLTQKNNHILGKFNQHRTFSFVFALF